MRYHRKTSPLSRVVSNTTFFIVLKIFKTLTHSPRYQKFKIDQLPVIKTFYKQDWQFLLEYYQWKYKKTLRPVQRRNGKSIPEDVMCPVCGAPHHFIYDNNGGNGQYQCKVCGQTFTSGESATTPVRLMCPHCGHTLVPKKDRKFFRIHKCVNSKCSYYLHQLSKVDPKDLSENYGKNKYKLHYIYRDFTVDFFAMDLNSLPKNASSLRFSKHNTYIMSLCLTMHVNLGLSLRKTSQALKDLYNISISHQQIANYCKTAAVCIKPFVDNYDYTSGSVFTADETYIKVRGIKAYIWFIMDAASRSIIGYQVSDNRSVGPCILAMRMAFRHLTKLPGLFSMVRPLPIIFSLRLFSVVRFRRGTKHKKCQISGETDGINLFLKSVIEIILYPFGMI